MFAFQVRIVILFKTCQEFFVLPYRLSSFIRSNDDASVRYGYIQCNIYLRCVVYDLGSFCGKHFWQLSHLYGLSLYLFVQSGYPFVKSILDNIHICFSFTTKCFVCTKCFVLYVQSALIRLQLE